MSFANLWEWLLGRGAPTSSKVMAKDRLRLVLMHDRADIPAPLMEQMRRELIELLNKYVEIDQDALEVALESDHSTVALIANIPIKRVKDAVSATAPAPAATAVAEAPVEAPPVAVESAS